MRSIDPFSFSLFTCFLGALLCTQVALAQGVGTETGDDSIASTKNERHHSDEYNIIDSIPTSTTNSISRWIMDQPNFDLYAIDNEFGVAFPLKSNIDFIYSLNRIPDGVARQIEKYRGSDQFMYFLESELAFKFVFDEASHKIIGKSPYWKNSVLIGEPLPQLGPNLQFWQIPGWSGF